MKTIKTLGLPVFFILALAIGASAQIKAWGRGDLGQLGNNSSLSPVPNPVDIGLSDVSGIGGWHHTLFLRGDGTVLAAGHNEWGQTGNGSFGFGTSVVTPFAIPGLTDIVQVTGGYGHSAALKADGTVWSWGNNFYGQIGIGSTTTSGCHCLPSPNQTLITGVIQIDAGREHTLALKADGTVWAWGHNFYGQMGNGTTTTTTTCGCQTLPVQSSVGTGNTLIHAGFSQSFARQGNAGCADANFAPAAYFASGGSAFAVAVGDFNLDGKPDLARVASTSLTILLGNGIGSFTAVSPLPLSGGSGFPSAAVVDFNTDGKPDLAITIPSTNNVTILLGDGLSGFTQPAGSPVGVGGSPQSVVVSDFNLDGKPDLATANSGSNNVTILLGDGLGGFTQPAGSPIGVGNTPAALAVGDFNLDGKPDLATSRINASAVSILLGDGLGGFTSSAVGVGSTPRSVAVGDFNLDGKPDLATANSGSNNVTILLGNGTGGFTALQGLPFGAANSLRSVAVGDFNLDGKPDLATAHFNTNNNVTILFGNGLGGFTQPAGSPLSVGDPLFSAVVGDFNLDGKPDLATANFANRVSVLLNTCGNTAPVAVDDSYNTNEDTALNEAAPGVLANDTDGENDTLTATLVFGPANAASFNLNSDGSFSYTPNPDFSGLDSFTYKASDGESESNTVTVQITVNADADADGVPDANDNCPNDANPDQSDTDNDGIGNACDPTPNGDTDGDGVDNNTDNCPLAANADQIDSDIDARGDVCDPDDDNDGINDGADNCPLAANPNQLDTDGDGQGNVCDADDDDDGVSDGSDNCSLTPNSDQSDTDNDGVGDACEPFVLITSPPSGAVYQIGSTVDFAGSFTDNDGDTHTAQWTFTSSGNSSTQAGVVDEINKTVGASRTFNSPGVYLVSLSVTDNSGNSGTATTVNNDLQAMVVIYDPDGGFVTGGGWIDSPAGAYRANLSLTGKASFGFVSKYQNGAGVPTGNTEFQFRAANFNFASASYEWLVIAGARAQYKGSGTINGSGDYGFMLTAIDGQRNAGGDLDKFRVKIWDKTNGEIVYDNQVSGDTSDNASPNTELGGGSIVIHKP